MAETVAALAAGTLALIYYAVLSTVSAGAALVQAVWLHWSPEEPNSFPFPVMLVAALAMLTASIMCSILAALVWKKRSLVAASTGTALIMWDVIAHRGLSLALPALPFVINAVRARLPKEAEQTKAPASPTAGAAILPLDSGRICNLR